MLSGWSDREALDGSWPALRWVAGRAASGGRPLGQEPHRPRWWCWTRPPCSARAAQPPPPPAMAPPVLVEGMPTHAPTWASSAGKSIFGDAYAQPSTWHPLGLSSILNRGVGRAVCGVADRDRRGRPRAAGSTPSTASSSAGLVPRLRLRRERPAQRHRGTSPTTASTSRLPNRRFEIRLDVPVTSPRAKGRTATTPTARPSATWPSAPLSCSRRAADFSELVGDSHPHAAGCRWQGNGVMSLQPQYHFWTNFVGHWIAQGPLGPHPCRSRVPTSGPRTSSMWASAISPARTPPSSGTCSTTWFRQPHHHGGQPGPQQHVLRPHAGRTVLPEPGPPVGTSWPASRCP